ncbi:transcriptional regulator, TetR family [Bradyrhizobium lablabi]|uniref:Transcriptional regulator, TetR family n=1 Tax=Bradyrhizobium lablabi TaxID=722472 RepID=A0A1M6PG05_9BRAD|nr:TetR/AcrR family transcriptional regulator [Bradyrhizobium lablabi]SHK06844.1 transcriptional regulator, TetR family [Bradyrhizobium lablabi]
MAVKERVRVGGRSARIQSAVHDAVRRLSAETDRDELTVPQIAAEAGVTPSTIYRRWGDLAALLADVAVERLRPIADPEDTGAVTSDLRAFIEQFMEEMSSPVGRALVRDVFSPPGETYPVQCGGFTREHLTTIVSRAKARGEAAFDIDEVIDHVVAPIIYHILYGDRELTLDYCHALLDRVQSMPAETARPASRSLSPGARSRDPLAPQ